MSPEGTAWPERWLGIDFSGNHLSWRAGRQRSNVWVAELRPGDGTPGLVLTDLRRVQALPGAGSPFERLAALLGAGAFEAAGIDAPFSVPARFLAGRSHRQLLAQVAGLASDERPFPSGAAFVRAVAGPAPLVPAKPLRVTESLWSSGETSPAGERVNVRSALWAGPRPGAPMAAACLTLLAASGARLWPWEREGRGLVAEAFPAAQLETWRLPHQQYNGSPPLAARNRQTILLALAERVQVGSHRATLGAEADALDALLAAFGAVAITRGTLVSAPQPEADLEGWICVHA